MIARLVRLQEHLHMHRDSNTGGLGTKWACVQFNNGLHMFQSHIHSLQVLHQSSATRTLILDVSMCNMICRRHDDPTNGPTGDPSMVRLP